jgi:ABC-2 type transport system ATP-binding protein
MDKVLLEVDKLSIWYETKKYIVKDSKLSISKNEIIALVGVNGAGKTTLINTLVGIHSKYSLGEFIFRNEKLEDFDNESFKMNRIAVFSQDESFRYWNFVEYMKFIFETYNISLDSKYIDYLIDGFSFKKYINYMKKDLSMGNKKKFSLIVAFGLRLPLLILDEPVDGLDFESTAFLYKIIKEYKTYGSILMSTHVTESINESCDSVVILNGGKIGSKNQIQNKLSISDILYITGE